MSEINTTEQAVHEWKQMFGVEAVGESSQAMLERLTEELSFNVKETAVCIKVILCDDNVDIEPLFGFRCFIIRLVKPNHIPATRKEVTTVTNDESGYNAIKIALNTLNRASHERQTGEGFPQCYNYDDVRWFLMQGGQLYINQWSLDEFRAMSELPAHLREYGQDNVYQFFVDYTHDEFSEYKESKYRGFLVSQKIDDLCRKFFFHVDGDYVYILHGYCPPAAIESDTNTVTLLTLIRQTTNYHGIARL